MTFNELLKRYFQQEEFQEREIGRYYASELYKIYTGELNSYNYFQQPKFNDEQLKHLFRGRIGEFALLELCKTLRKHNVQYQDKKIYHYKDKEVEFDIVCKADLVFQDFLIEIKSPRQLPDKILPWHKPQLEAYYRTFNKKVYIWYFDTQKIHLKQFVLKPSEAYWDEILYYVKELHKQLISLQRIK